MDCGTETCLTLAILCCRRRRYVCTVLATVASSKGRGEHWAEPLVQLTTEQLDVAKKYTPRL